MPKYSISDPVSGKTVVVDVDGEPSPKDFDAMRQHYFPAPASTDGAEAARAVTGNVRANNFSPLAGGQSATDLSPYSAGSAPLLSTGMYPAGSSDLKQRIASSGKASRKPRTQSSLAPKPISAEDIDASVSRLQQGAAKPISSPAAQASSLGAAGVSDLQPIPVGADPEGLGSGPSVVAGTRDPMQAGVVHDRGAAHKANGQTYYDEDVDQYTRKYLSGAASAETAPSQILEELATYPRSAWDARLEGVSEVGKAAIKAAAEERLKATRESYDADNAKGAGQLENLFANNNRPMDMSDPMSLPQAFAGQQTTTKDYGPSDVVNRVRDLLGRSAGALYSGRSLRESEPGTLVDPVGMKMATKTGGVKGALGSLALGMTSPEMLAMAGAGEALPEGAGALMHALTPAFVADAAKGSYDQYQKGDTAGAVTSGLLGAAMMLGPHAVHGVLGHMDRMSAARSAEAFRASPIGQAIYRGEGGVPDMESLRGTVPNPFPQNEASVAGAQSADIGSITDRLKNATGGGVPAASGDDFNAGDQSQIRSQGSSLDAIKARLAAKGMVPEAPARTRSADVATKDPVTGDYVRNPDDAYVASAYAKSAADFNDATDARANMTPEEIAAQYDDAASQYGPPKKPDVMSGPSDLYHALQQHFGYPEELAQASTAGLLRAVRRNAADRNVPVWQAWHEAVGGVVDGLEQDRAAGLLPDRDGNLNQGRASTMKEYIDDYKKANGGRLPGPNVYMKRGDDPYHPSGDDLEQYRDPKTGKLYAAVIHGDSARTDDYPGHPGVTMHGGPKYGISQDRYGHVVWSSAGAKADADVQRQTAITRGLGVTIAGAPTTALSSNHGVMAYMAEIDDAVGRNPSSAPQVIDTLKGAFKAAGQPEPASLADVHAIMGQMSFDNRLNVLKRLGGQRVSKKLGIPTQDVIARKVLDPDYANTPTHHATSFLHFDGRPSGTAADFGVAAHPTYHFANGGLYLGDLHQQMPLTELAKPTYDRWFERESSAYKNWLDAPTKVKEDFEQRIQNAPTDAAKDRVIAEMKAAGYRPTQPTDQNFIRSLQYTKAPVELDEAALRRAIEAPRKMIGAKENVHEVQAGDVAHTGDRGDQEAGSPVHGGNGSGALRGVQAVHEAEEPGSRGKVLGQSAGRDRLAAGSDGGSGIVNAAADGRTVTGLDGQSSDDIRSSLIDAIGNAVRGRTDTIGGDNGGSLPKRIADKVRKAVGKDGDPVEPKIPIVKNSPINERSEVVPIATGGGKADPGYHAEPSSLGHDPSRPVKNMATFAGGGLWDQGTKRSAESVAAVELDPAKAAHYALAHGDHITAANVIHVDYNPLNGDVHMLHASPVCTRFSAGNRQRGEAPVDLETAEATSRAIREIQPPVVTIENVPEYWGSHSLSGILATLNKEGYRWDAAAYNAKDFGVPSDRSRLLIRAWKYDEPLPPVVATHGPGRANPHVGWYDAVKDLIPSFKEEKLAPWQLRRLGVGSADELAEKLFVAGGSGFKGQIPHAVGEEPAPTIKATHKEPHRIVMVEGDVAGGARPPTVRTADQQFPTLRTGGGGRIFRTVEPGEGGRARVLRVSQRALARIQGLPDEYPLPESAAMSQTIIGNGVPPPLAAAIAEPLARRVEQDLKASGGDGMNSAGIPAANAQKTQRPITKPTYEKAGQILRQSLPAGARVLDYGAGLGHGVGVMGDLGYHADSLEPFPQKGFAPDFTRPDQVPKDHYDATVSLNVINVLPPKERAEMVRTVGDSLKAGGTAIITSRGRDVYDARVQSKADDTGGVIVGEGDNRTYQKGFTQPELRQYVQDTLGSGYRVESLDLGPAGVRITKESGPRTLNQGSGEKDALGFYSTAERVVGAKMGGKMPADALSKMLRANGVKPEEMAQTGLQAYLDERGSQPVTKSEVVAALERGRLGINEQVTRQADWTEHLKAKAEYDRLDPQQNAHFRAVDIAGKDAGLNPREIMELKWHAQGNHPLDMGKYPESVVSAVRALQEFHEKRNELHRRMEETKPTGEDTMFSGFKLPGGENYREHLLTLPTTDPTFAVFHDEDQISPEFRSHTAARDWARENRVPSGATIRQANEADDTFVGDHWREPNVLAHYRTTDRTGPNGEKILHVEEVQSDWHQGGRKYGVKGHTFAPGEMPPGYEVTENSNYTGPGKYYEVTRPDGSQGSVGPTRESLVSWAQHDALHAIDQIGVPPAPFGKTWHELAFRRIMQKAAEEGYDKVTWSKGAAHAHHSEPSLYGTDRYSWAPSETDPNGGTTIRFKNQVSGTGGGFNLETEANRRGMNDGTAIEFNPAKHDSLYLERHIGRVDRESTPLERQRTAKKLMSLMQESPEGGVHYPREHGMKGYYDEVLPNYANKFGKRYGAQVHEVSLEHQDKSPRTMLRYTNPLTRTEGLYADIRIGQVTDPNNGRRLWKVFGIKPDGTSEALSEGYYNNQDASHAVMFARNDAVKVEMPPEVKTNAVHAIDVTPAMKDAALTEGQNLYQNTPGDDLPRAQIQYPDKSGIAPIYRAMTDPDASSFLPHEFGHELRKMIYREVAEGRSTRFTQDDLQKLEQEFGVKRGKRNPDGSNWSDKAEEKFAAAHERYWADGKAPTPEAQGVFDQFKRWMGQLWEKVSSTHIPEKLNPHVADIFERAYGRDTPGSLDESPSGRPAHEQDLYDLNDPAPKNNQNSLGRQGTFSPPADTNDIGTPRPDGIQLNTGPNIQPFIDQDVRPTIDKFKEARLQARDIFNPASADSKAGYTARLIRRKKTEVQVRNEDILDHVLSDDRRPLMAKLRDAGEALKDTFLKKGNISPQAGESARVSFDKIGRRMHPEEPRRVAALPDADRSEFVRKIKAGEEQDTPSLQAYADQLAFTHRIETGQAEPDPVLAGHADNIRKFVDHMQNELRSLPEKAVDTFLTHYFPHLWEDPKGTGASPLAALTGKRPWEGSKSFTKKRTVPTILDGVERGLVPVTTNAADMLRYKYHEVMKYAAFHHIMADLRSMNMLVHHAGGTLPPGFARIDDRFAKIVQYKQTYKKDGSPGAVERVDRGEWIAPEGVARVINNHLSPGLSGPIHDIWRTGTNTITQLSLSLSGYHGTFTVVNSATSQVARGLEKAVWGVTHPRAGVKAAKLIGQGIADVATFPIAPARDWAFGKLLQKEWLDPGSTNPQIGALVKAIVEGGGRMRQEQVYSLRDPVTGRTAAEQLKGRLRTGNLIGAVPKAIKAGAELSLKPIMEKLVPTLKLAATAHRVAFDLDTLPASATEDERAKAFAATVDSMDNRFGQLNYDSLFMNNVAKDLAMRLVRAPGFNLGTVRELGGSKLDAAMTLPRVLKGGPLLTSKMAYAIALPAVTMIMGTVAQKMMTGEWAKDARDAMYPRDGTTRPDGKPGRIVIPSYQAAENDFWTTLHDDGMGGAFSWLMQEAGHKLNSVYGLALDLENNRDYFNNQIADPEADLATRLKQKTQYAAKQYSPFAIRSAIERMAKGGTAAKSAAGIVIGTKPARYDIDYTPFDKKMHGYLQDKLPQGSRTLESQDKGAQTKSLKDRLQGSKLLSDPTASGKMKMQAVHDALQAGVGKRGARAAVKGSIQGDPRIGMFKRLDAEQAVAVYREGNAEERALVRIYLLKKLRDDVRDKGRGLSPAWEKARDIPGLLPNISASESKSSTVSGVKA